MNQLKIVHLVAGELTGGAARGAYWLHRGLLASNVQSTILTSSKITFGEPEIVSVNNNENRSLINTYTIEEAELISHYPDKKEGLFSSGYWGLDLSQNDVLKDADIVHLHWVNSHFFDFTQLRNLNKPIVWTLRDMWPMTGGCHYSYECRQFESECGNCPLLGGQKEQDLSTEVQRRKRSLFPTDVHFVGISEWISQQARKSKLLGKRTISTIYNCVDCSNFFPVEKTMARKALGLTTSKKVLLIGATRLKDRYKGFDLLKEILNKLDKNQFYLMVFGASNESDIQDFGFEYKRLGYLYDEISMRIVYSASDVFLCTSTIEAFGKTVAEAMACGTPAVSFDNSGPREIIEHKVTGYVAKSFEIDDFIEGIFYVCCSFNEQSLRYNSVKRIAENFDNTVIAKRYIDLYRSLKKQILETNI